MTVDLPAALETPLPPARYRARASCTHQLHVRLTAEELRDIATAAAKTGLRPTGYAGEVAVAAARAGGAGAGTIRAELARVQHDLFAARTALVYAAGPDETPGGPDLAACASAALTRLDAAAERLHGLLLQQAEP